MTTILITQATPPSKPCEVCGWWWIVCYDPALCSQCMTWAEENGIAFRFQCALGQ